MWVNCQDTLQLVKPVDALVLKIRHEGMYGGKPVVPRRDAALLGISKPFQIVKYIVSGDIRKKYILCFFPFLLTHETKIQHKSITIG